MTDALVVQLQAAVNASPAYSEAREAGLLLVGLLVRKCPKVGVEPFPHAQAVKTATGKKPITAYGDLQRAGQVRACPQPC